MPDFPLQGFPNRPANRPRLSTLLPLLLALFITFASAFSSHVSGATDSATHSTKAVGVARDKKGHIARSSTARERFMKSHPCPSTGKTSGACPGYVLDHVVALKRGGKDDPSNMQWQTIQAAKDKDRWE